MEKPSPIRTLLRSKGFQKYLKNTSWLTGGKVIQMGITFWVTAYVARYLGPDQFGVLSYARSFGTFFIIFAALGLKEILIRNLVKNPDDERTILGTAIVLRWTGAFIAFWVCIGLVPFFPHDTIKNLLIMLVVGSAFFQAFDAFEGFFHSKVQAHRSVKVRFVAVLSFALVQLVLVIMEAPLLWFGYAFLFRNVMAGLGMTLTYARVYQSPLKLRFSGEYAWDLLKDSWPLVFSGMVVIFYMKIDQVMLGLMEVAPGLPQGDTAVGIYTSALRFSEIWYFLGPAITSSLFPAILNAQIKDPLLYRRRLKDFYALMVGLALVIAIPTTLVGPWFLRQEFLFGEKFTPAGPVLQLHIWALIFVFMGVASSKQLVAENLQKIALYRTVLGAIINVALNLVLIPRYSVIGAAWATIASQAFASYLGYFFSSKTRNIFYLQTQALFLQPLFKKLIRRN